MRRTYTLTASVISVLALLSLPVLAKQGAPHPLASPNLIQGAPHEFRHLDDNADGYISILESASATVEIGEGRRLADNFARFDSDDDQLLSLEEYYASRR